MKKSPWYFVKEVTLLFHWNIMLLGAMLDDRPQDVDQYPANARCKCNCRQSHFLYQQP